MMAYGRAVAGPITAPIHHHVAAAPRVLPGSPPPVADMLRPVRGRPLGRCGDLGPAPGPL